MINLALEVWKIIVDGASNKQGGGVGVVIITPENSFIEHSYILAFIPTNNQVEYEEF